MYFQPWAESNSSAFFSLTILITSPAASSSMLWLAKLERVSATGVSGGPTDGVVDEAAGDVDAVGSAEVVEWRYPG